MKVKTYKTYNARNAEKSIIALTLNEIHIVQDALSANRQLLRQDCAKYLTLLKQDELSPSYDEREKHNVRASLNICENQVMEISTLIQEINGQLI